jgi:hypothetical protein
MRIILLSYSDEGYVLLNVLCVVGSEKYILIHCCRESVSAPALTPNKAEALNMLKSANNILENYKIQIIEKVRSQITSWSIKRFYSVSACLTSFTLYRFAKRSAKGPKLLILVERQSYLQTRGLLYIPVSCNIVRALGPAPPPKIVMLSA